MREDATSSEDVLQVNQGALTVCKIASKGGKDQCASISEDRDEKTGSSCIKIPQLGRGDNDVQSPQIRGKRSKMQKMEREAKWAETEPKRSQAGRPCRPAHPLLVVVRGPLSSVLSTWTPNHLGKSPFARDTI
jgi:hypothetical protein